MKGILIGNEIPMENKMCIKISRLESKCGLFTSSNSNAIKSTNFLCLAFTAFDYFGRKK
jgi:hypothetical protein